MITLRLLEEAEEQADVADDWWQANRPANPLMFADELDAALGSLMEFPMLGRVAGLREYPNARKWLLQSTGYAMARMCGCGIDAAASVDAAATGSTRPVVTPRRRPIDLLVYPNSHTQCGFGF